MFKYPSHHLDYDRNLLFTMQLVSNILKGTYECIRQGLLITVSY